jgi:hypothetical protein
MFHSSQFFASFFAALCASLFALVYLILYRLFISFFDFFVVSFFTTFISSFVPFLFHSLLFLFHSLLFLLHFSLHFWFIPRYFFTFSTIFCFVFHNLFVSFFAFRLFYSCLLFCLILSIPFAYFWGAENIIQISKFWNVWNIYLCKLRIPTKLSHFFSDHFPFNISNFSNICNIFVI